MAKVAMKTGLSTRMVVITSVVALALTALLLYMYPTILQTLGLKAPSHPIGEGFETAEPQSGGIVDDADAGDVEEGEEEEEEDYDVEGESDFDDEWQDDDEEESDEDESDDDDEVSIGTDSNVEITPDGSKEGFSLLKRAPPPQQTTTKASAKSTIPATTTATAPSKRLIVIHASWCGHCKTLLSTSGPWKQVKKALPGVTIDELDESEHPDLVKSLDIQSFPTIMILDSVNQNAVPYDGPRTKDAIVDFALRNIKPEDI